MDGPSPSHRSPRRAAGEERTRSATQTRERILAAAVAEFGAKGYSGARTAAIAARAGVNPQLISYYFGGKQGLLTELRRRWAEEEAGLAPPDASFGASVAGYLDAVGNQPDWARLVIWQALGDPEREPAQTRSAYQARITAAVERIRARQESGELTPDVDPAFVLLLAHLVAFAPVAMPHLVEALFDTAPGGPEYRRHCLEQLLRLVRADRPADHPQSQENNDE